MTQPPQAMIFQSPINVSTLSQELEHASLDNASSNSSNNKVRHSSPQRPSAKRKSKSDYSGLASGYDLPETQTKPRRSPKSKINGAKHLSTPSKLTSMPNASASLSNAIAQPHGTTANGLAEHYAGPTFHSSPAPSSLPLPSFFASKSSSPKPAVSNGYEPDSPPNDQSTPTRHIRSVNENAFQDQDDSPLALFFRADREEKSKLRNKHYSENDVFGSPSLRPASADGIPDYLNIRSGSPLLWHDSPQKASGRFDLKSKLCNSFPTDKIDHSTSELPFHVNTERENVVRPRNHLIQRYRASTEPPTEHNGIHNKNDAINHISQRSQQGSYVPFPPQPQSLHETDLEASTKTLKSLLSIKSPPDHSRTPPFATVDMPPSPSPIQHNRTRSAVQPIVCRTLSTGPTTSPCRRNFSTSGVPPIAFNHTGNYTSKSPNGSPEYKPSEDPETLKMEKQLRKVLNLS